MYTRVIKCLEHSSQGLLLDFFIALTPPKLEFLGIWTDLKSYLDEADCRAMLVEAPKHASQLYSLLK